RYRDDLGQRVLAAHDPVCRTVLSRRCVFVHLERNVQERALQSLEYQLGSIKMATLLNLLSIHRRTRTASSGQAAVEFAVIATVLLVLLLAVVDFSRALYSLQVMVGLTRQGSNLASRGDTLAQAASSVVSGDSPLNLDNNGEVIITSVMNTAGRN